MTNDITAGVCFSDANFDIFFVVDGSGSIGIENFQHVREFLSSVINSLNIGDNLTRVGLIQFASYNIMEFELNKFFTKSDMINTINTMEYLYGNTAIGEAIQFALDEGFIKQAGDRSCNTDIMIVMTDGQDDGVIGVNRPVQEASCRRVLTYAIGVGNRVDERQLLTIAGGDSKKVFRVDSFPNLLSIIKPLCNQIQGKQVNPCDSKPCMNNGTCMSELNGRKYVCFCQHGYIGTLCETDINECASTPCMNNGTCLDGVGKFHCNCTVDFHGDRCQFSNCAPYIPIVPQQQQQQQHSNSTAQQQQQYPCPCPCILLIALCAILGMLLLLLALLLWRQCLKPKGKSVMPIVLPLPKPVFSHTEIERPVVVPPLLLEPIQMTMESVVTEKEFLLASIDILFLVDNSGSIGLSNFRRVKQFMKNFISNMDFTDDRSRLAILVFNRDAKIHLNFDSVTDVHQVVQAIDSMPYEGHATQLGNALGLVCQVIPQTLKIRPKVPKLVVVVSDGFTDDEWEKPVAILKSMPVTVVAVAVRQYNHTILEALTGDTKRIFHVQHADNLNKFFTEHCVQEISTQLKTGKTKKKKTRRASSIATMQLPNTVERS